MSFGTGAGATRCGAHARNGWDGAASNPNVHRTRRRVRTVGLYCTDLQQLDRTRTRFAPQLPSLQTAFGTFGVIPPSQAQHTHMLALLCIYSATPCPPALSEGRWYRAGWCHCTTPERAVNSALTRCCISSPRESQTASAQLHRTCICCTDPFGSASTVSSGPPLLTAITPRSLYLVTSRP